MNFGEYLYSVDRDDYRKLTTLTSAKTTDDFFDVKTRANAIVGIKPEDRTAILKTLFDARDDWNKAGHSVAAKVDSELTSDHPKPVQRMTAEEAAEAPSRMTTEEAEEVADAARSESWP